MQLPEGYRVYDLDVRAGKVAIAGSDRLVAQFDVGDLLRGKQLPERVCACSVALAHARQSQWSPLKWQTRRIRLLPNNTGYVITSINGAIAIQYFSSDEKYWVALKTG